MVNRHVAKLDYIENGATFSECKRYRYRLWRRWLPSPAPVWVFLMLNPSTADEAANDPTVERCERRARMGGAGALEVVNVFAWRSTDPHVLPYLADPVGRPENDRAIVEACKGAERVICGWGKHAGDRGRYVLSILRAAGVRPLCLAVNKDGSPRHPLYVGYGGPLLDVPAEGA